MDQEILTPNNTDTSKTGSISVYYFILDFLLKITWTAQFKVTAVIGYSTHWDSKVIGLIVPAVCVDDQLLALVQGST